MKFHSPSNLPSKPSSLLSTQMNFDGGDDQMKFPDPSSEKLFINEKPTELENSAKGRQTKHFSDA
jgi:hypothetical protein